MWSWRPHRGPPRELQDSSDSSSSGLATEGRHHQESEGVCRVLSSGATLGDTLDVLPRATWTIREPPDPWRAVRRP
jgi:hypothetical protein